MHLEILKSQNQQQQKCTVVYCIITRNHLCNFRKIQMIMTLLLEIINSVITTEFNLFITTKNNKSFNLPYLYLGLKLTFDK